MSLRERLRSLFRLFFLFTVLAAVALVSAITTIRLSIRGHQEKVPEFSGVPLNEAQRVAVERGLELRVADRLFSLQVPVNHIVSQQPPAGTQVKVGQQIHVLVSLGPPQVTVPDLVGSSLRAAQITAVQRGLSVGNVAALAWPGAAPDQVVAHDPPPLTENPSSPAVNFLVALPDPPPVYLCPSFIGKPLSEARRILENAGFKVASVTRVPVGGITSETILSQSPGPGGKITPDTLFSFQVVE
jgi:serine/threonine-protein kinase